MANKEQGQVQIGILILIIIGLVLFVNFSKPLGQSQSEKTSPSAEPVFQQETVISPSQNSTQEQEKEEEPSPPDVTPPKRSKPQPKGDLPAETRKITMSLETDEPATCKYATVDGVSYEYIQHAFSETNSTSHSILITTLSEGEEYKYYVKCIDGSGNKNTDDFEISFKVKIPEDKTPPVRRNAYPTGDILPASTTQVMIGISTDEPASCRYSTEQGKEYGSGYGLTPYDQTKKYHTAKISGVVSGNYYEYFIRCKDLNGNANSGDVMVYFSIE